MSSSQCGIPFTYGFRKPYIILPESSADWTAERLNSILLHELAHIRRNDFLYKTITSIVCSLFWFLPIVWLAHSYMLREEEKSCDQYVIDEGYSGVEYALDVVDVVNASRGRLLLPSAYSGIGQKGRLKARIKNIISIEPHQISRLFKRAGLVLIVSFCCLLPLMGMTYTTGPYIPTSDEVLYGVWENEACAKCRGIMIFAHQGISYSYIEDRNRPMFEDRYEITDKWLDMEGHVCYKLAMKESFYPYDESQVFKRWYCIARIDPEGNSLELVWSETEYPKEFSGVGGGNYIVYTKK